MVRRKPGLWQPPASPSTPPRALGCLVPRAPAPTQTGTVTATVTATVTERTRTRTRIRTRTLTDTRSLAGARIHVRCVAWLVETQRERDRHTHTVEEARCEGKKVGTGGGRGKQNTAECQTRNSGLMKRAAMHAHMVHGQICALASLVRYAH